FNGRRSVPLFRYNTPDASAVNRENKITRSGLFAEVGRQIGNVLNESSVHVGDIQRTVRPLGQVDGPEALVSGGEEFLAGMRIFGADVQAVFHQHISLNQVARRLAYEGVAI